jgi:hypothetical protein
MKKRSKFVLLLIVLSLGLTLWYLDFSEPVVTWNAAPSVGKSSQIGLEIKDEGKGLKRIEVTLRQADSVHTVFSQDYPATKLPWHQGPVF